jgi:two-component system chemotaxis response regulator CheB
MNHSLQGGGRQIRVLVVDDSAFIRTALTRMIESDPLLSVVATAIDGREALEKIVTVRPDVVTLDVEMPVLDGLETLRRLMRNHPCPVIMVSSATQEGAEATLEALDIGAFDYVAKPPSCASLDIVKVRDDLIAKLKAAATLSMRRPNLQVEAAPPSVQQLDPAYPIPGLVVIGSSTGGPKALQQILPMLPADLPVGLLIVQHMPPGFTAPFARRLDGLCNISVREANAGDVLAPGMAYIAPAGQHMTVIRRGAAKFTLNISPFPEETLHKPSVDVTMLSAAESCSSLSMGIIMTGMGADGMEGMKAIARAGGLTVGQNEATCAVYGMPRSCAEAGVLRRIVPLNNIPKQILLATRYQRRI